MYLYSINNIENTVKTVGKGPETTVTKYSRFARYQSFTHLFFQAVYDYRGILFRQPPKKCWYSHLEEH